MRHKLAMIAAGPFDRAALETLIRLQEDAVEQVAKAPTLSPMEASDREDALGDWLDDHGVAGGWDLAPTFVQAGLDADWLGPGRRERRRGARSRARCAGWTTRSRPSC